MIVVIFIKVRSRSSCEKSLLFMEIFYKSIGLRGIELLRSVRLYLCSTYAVCNRFIHSFELCNKTIIHVYLRSDKTEKDICSLVILISKLKSFSIYNKVLHCKQYLYVSSTGMCVLPYKITSNVG